MKRTLHSLLLGLCLATLAQAATPTVEEQIKSFQEKASAVLEKRARQATSDQRNNYSAYAGGALMQLALRWQSNPGAQEFEQAVTQVVAATGNDADVLKAANDLLTAVKADRDERVAAFRTELKALLARTGEACLAAKTPADLDATLALLAPYSRNSGYERRVADDQESWQRGSSAYRFVTRWQDYLAALGQRNIGEANNILRDLSSSVDVGIMPRSRVVALLSPATGSKPDAVNPLADITGQLEKARTLEEFIAVSRAFRTANPNNQNQQNPLQQVLANLIDDRQQTLAGNHPASLFSESGSGRQLSPQDPSSSEAIQSALLAFRRETQFAGIRLALTGAALPAAKADDTLDTYITRVVEKFVAEKNWLQVREALELQRTFFNNSRAPSWLTGDIEGITAYLSARNLDLAEQYPAAIASYRRALRNVGRYLPVDAIGTRLAELKKSNPEAFADAAANADADPNATYRNNQSYNLPPGAGASIPRSPGGLRPAAPTGPLTPAPAPAAKPATATP